MRGFCGQMCFPSQTSAKGIHWIFNHQTPKRETSLPFTSALRHPIYMTTRFLLNDFHHFCRFLNDKKQNLMITIISVMCTTEVEVPHCYQVSCCSCKYSISTWQGHQKWDHTCFSSCCTFSTDCWLLPRAVWRADTSACRRFSTSFSCASAFCRCSISTSSFRWISLISCCAIVKLRSDLLRSSCAELSSVLTRSNSAFVVLQCHKNKYKNYSLFSANEQYTKTAAVVKPTSNKLEKCSTYVKVAKKHCGIPF